MNTKVWIIVVPLALLLVPSHMSAGRALSSQTGADTSAKDVDKTKDAVVDGAKIVVDKTKDGLSKTGEAITDGWITTRVRERFVGEDLLKDSDISVNTTKHVVTLKGTVIGRAGRARAIIVALHTEGVHRVVSRLTLGPKVQE
jgi:osmotically-inducible protein OsmY